MRRASRTTTDFDRYLGELESEAEKKVVAYFDLDRTLIAGYSITALALEKMWSGSLSAKRILTHALIFLGWGLGRSDYHDLLEATMKRLVGMSEAEMVELGERAFERRLKSLVYDEGRRLIRAHQACAHETVMITSATRYQAEPIARALGVERMYCTELEIRDGMITGNVTPCYGAGKKTAADRHAARRDADLADAYFYSDSTEDLPLLEAVGKPVAVNAKTALAKLAEEKGWPQLLFETQGESSPAIAA